MIVDKSNYTTPVNDHANTAEQEPPRILARQLARPLTAEENDYVSGGLLRAVGGTSVGLRASAGGTCSAGTCCTPDCDD